MTEKLKQITKEEMIKLPKETQIAINSFDWVKMTEGVGKKYLLTESEINDLQVETLLVLVGIEDYDSYALNVENKVDTSKEEAEKITEEITQKIFMPIGSILIENIKKSGKAKDANTEQNLDFILSGGDYSAFIAQREIEQETSTPLESRFSGWGKLNSKKQNMDDMRNKFTI